MENVLIDNTAENIDTWAYIEIMGHDKIAGRVSERKVGVAVMLQVDVPAPNSEGFSHSKLFSPSSIFSIQPTTEEWCRRWVTNNVSFRVLPYNPEQKKLNQPDLFNNGEHVEGFDEQKELDENEEEFDRFMDDEDNYN